MSIYGEYYDCPEFRDVCRELFGWTPSDELNWDGFEDEYSTNHCYPQEW